MLIFPLIINNFARVVWLAEWYGMICKRSPSLSRLLYRCRNRHGKPAPLMIKAPSTTGLEFRLRGMVMLSCLYRRGALHMLELGSYGCVVEATIIAWGNPC